MIQLSEDFPPKAKFYNSLILFLSFPTNIRCASKAKYIHVTWAKIEKVCLRIIWLKNVCTN